MTPLSTMGVSSRPMSLTVEKETGDFEIIFIIRCSLCCSSIRLKKQRFPAISNDLFPQQDFSKFELRAPRQNKLPPTLFRDDTSSTSKKDDGIGKPRSQEGKIHRGMTFFKWEIIT